MPAATISETFINAGALGGCTLVRAFNQRRDYGHWFQRTYLSGRKPDMFYTGGAAPGGPVGGLAMLGAHTGTYGGVCWAMSMHWILRHSRGLDFWGWIDTPGGISTIINLQMRTRRFPGALQLDQLGSAPERAQGAPSGRLVEEEVLGADGMVRIGTTEGETQDRLIAALQKVTDYGLVGMFFRGLPIGHAIVVHAPDRSGPLTVFDPNGGEVRFTDREKANLFLYRLFYQTAYAVVRRWRIHGYGETLGLTRLFG
ncbi:YopT-type cysteine protease domain-containing protein [Falsiroseomonas oryzae]|uniref:YopT-type cysteine protease domain-containing protein n=1 Tax=Falsiroseomonas oryzae TaxID=2766473 RepID=UPI0022EAD840|nr:YopT-type cysteine protease domain-containing protein [Roseomonas sp. MO-31]